jgi:hypothetical protein
VTREIEITGDERIPEHVEEIALLAVDLRGIVGGRSSTHALKGVEFVQVKRLGPSYPSRESQATRPFCDAIGYCRLEETHGSRPNNPRFILVKRLSGAS